jgi:hypothetical protein
MHYYTYGSAVTMQYENMETLNILKCIVEVTNREKDTSIIVSENFFLTHYIFAVAAAVVVMSI